MRIGGDNGRGSRTSTLSLEHDSRRWEPIFRKHRVGPVSLVEIVRRSGYRAIMTDSKDASQSGYTYAKAGVSIAAGNALVKAIAPLARATARPGANADLGGFGAFFDPRAARYKGRSEERRVGKECVNTCRNRLTG